MADINKFLDNMVAKGKITQKEADKKKAKHTAKESVKADYKVKKDKMTKAELQAVIDTLIAP
jgi:polyhydroxyalkanoate synthesis regulator phasin